MKKPHSSLRRMGVAYFLFCSQIFSASAVAQQLTNEITPGILNIKVTEEIAQTLEQSNARRSLDDVLITGIRSLDAVHQRYQVRGIKRVFRPAGLFEAKHRRHGLHLWYQVAIDSSVSPTAVVTAYRSVPGITISEPVYKKVTQEFAPESSVDSIPSLEPGTLPRATNDPKFGYQWHFNNSVDYYGPVGIDIDLLYAWELETGNSDVVVAVVDGGIDTKHKDLAATMWRNEDEIPSNKVDDDGNGYIDDVHGYNFVYDRGPVEASYHATHVAGTVAATTNNEIGVAGVAGGSGIGDGARLMSCQIFSESGFGGGIAEAFVYSADNGAIISQNSWGYRNPNVFEQVVLDGIDYFIAEAGKDENGKQVGPMNGGVVIFAAGNANSQEPHFPAYYEPTIAVAATNRSDVKSSYSNFGEWVDIAAPGGGDGDWYVPYDIWSTVPGYYDGLHGTSMACSHVSGVAALIVSKFGGPGFTPDMLREKLFRGTESIDDKNASFVGLLGSGRLNAYAALITDEGVSPDRIQDLSVIDVNKDSVTLEWTTPADPDAGTAYRYELRYGWDPFTEANFFTFGNIVNIPVLKAKGMKDTFVISSLEPQQTYYFAIVSYDFYGHVSGISNVIKQSTSPTPWLNLPKNFIADRMKTRETKSYSLPIVNIGGAALHFHFVTSDPEIFATLSQTEGIVPPNDTLELTVTFRSNSLVPGVYFQYYEILNNGYYDAYPCLFQMEVTAVKAPAIALGSKIVDFENGFIGVPKVEILTIHNDGTQPLVLTGITSQDPVFTTSLKDSLTIAPFKDARIRITFKATMQRTYDRRLVIHSNDPKRPTTYVRVMGRGALPPAIEVSPTSVHTFLNTDQKTSSPLTIKNTGLSELEFSTSFELNTDAAVVDKVLILTPDMNPMILSDLFKGDDKIKADLFPKDSIPGIKLGHLLPYDVVFVNNASDWGTYGANGSPEVIGDLLADYIDRGGKVIVNNQVYYGSFGHRSPQGLSGRFIEEEYGPFRPSMEGGCGPCSLDTIMVADHPLMKGVVNLESIWAGLKLELTPGAVEIARWADGVPLIGVKPGVVAVNTQMFFTLPVLGQFSRLYKNAVKWLRYSFMSVVPAHGIVPAGQQQTIDVRFDMGNMKMIGRHEINLMISHNVPRKKIIKVPIIIDALGPALVMSPDTVKVILDSVRTGTRSIILHNNSLGEVSFSIRMDSATYIRVQPASGTIAPLDSISLTIDFDARELQYGEYVHHLIVSADGKNELIVPVILSVTDDPEIQIDPLALNASVGFREDTVQYFNIMNTGGSPLNFRIDVEGAGTDNSHIGAGAILLEDHFEGPVFPPDGWEILDNPGYGKVWTVFSEEANFSGTGRAATTTDNGDGIQLDTELRTPEMIAKGYKQIVLEFVANHQGGDLDVDILIDGKLPWKNLLHWLEGHGWYYDLPGEFVSISLDSILTGATYFQLRWRNYYLYSNSGYSQIDDILIKADPIEWLVIKPSVGVIAAGDTAKVSAIFYAEDLESRSYDSKMLIVSNTGNDSLVTIPVSVKVLKPAVLVIEPDSIYQKLSTGDSATQVLVISNLGESPLHFTIDQVSVATLKTTSSTRKERRSSARTTSARTPLQLDDRRSIPRTSSARRFPSSSSVKLYATGFEEFYPGELDAQEGWYADPGVWSIESSQPFSGTQHMRGVSDVYGRAVAVSPTTWFGEGPSPPVTSVTMQINLDSALGGRWQVIPESQTWGYVTTRIDFTPEGTMRALVQDTADVYNAYWVDIPVAIPKGYFELRVDVFSPSYQFVVYINNEKVFTGDCIADAIEEVAFLFDTDVPGLKMDVDNLRQYVGLSPISWVKAEPLSGTVPGGGSLPVNIHFNASDLGAGTFHHKMVFKTNDPLQNIAALPVTLRVLPRWDNTLPVIAPVPDTSVVQTTDLILTFAAHDENDSVASIGITNPPSFGKKLEEGRGYAIYQFRPSLTDKTGLYDITVTATNTKGNSSSSSFQLTILPYGIKDFSVVDLRTDSTLAYFNDSISVDAGRRDFRYLTIRANTQPEKVGAILFRIDGGNKHVENTIPYELPGNLLRNLAAGPHTLSAETFTRPLAQGVAQQSRQALIVLTNGTAVSGFEVVNQYGERIQELRNGDLLDVQDPRYEWMNIRALLTEDPLNGSVKFYLNGMPRRIENQPPYLMDTGTRKWWSSSGSYTVEATPFSKRNGNGIPGGSLNVTFTIADKDGTNAARHADASEEVQGELLSAYPVSTHRFIHIVVNENTGNSYVQLVIRNIHSQVLFKEEMAINAQPLTLDLDKIGLNDGVYYLQVRTPSTIKSIRFIKE